MSSRITAWNLLLNIMPYITWYHFEFSLKVKNVVYITWTYKRLLSTLIIIINSVYRAQITFTKCKSLSAFRTRIDRYMYKNTQKQEEQKYISNWKHIIKYHSLHNNGNYFTNKWDFNKDLNWSSDEHSLISSGSWFQRWGIEYWKDRWPYDLVTTLCGVNNCLVLDRSSLEGWYSWRSCCK